MHAPAGAPPWPVPDSGSSSLLDRQYRVSSTALRTRSFWNMRARWASIVRCDTPNSAAMTLLGLPVATYAITSRSRGVSTATRLSLKPDRMKSLIAFS